MAHAAATHPIRRHRPHAERPPSGPWKFLIIAVATVFVTGVSISYLTKDGDGTAQTRPALAPQDVPAPADAVQPDVAPQNLPQEGTPGGAVGVLTPRLQEPSGTRSAELSPSLGGLARIQDIDLTKVPEIVAFAETTGGSIAVKAAQFTDVTADGRDEALVSVASGGTFGNLGYFVVTLNDGWPEVIRQATVDRSSRHGLNVQVENGLIVETSGIYGPEDPNCCPSSLRKTYYVWDGHEFQISASEIIPNLGTKTD
jgi:hypothetical protein